VINKRISGLFVKRQFGNARSNLWNSFSLKAQNRKFYHTTRGVTKMSTILLLIDEVPWLMAPATLIAVTSVITIVCVVIRHTRWPFKSIVLVTILALTAGIAMFTGIYKSLLIHHNP